MSGGGKGGGDTVGQVAPSYSDPVNGLQFLDPLSLNAEIAQRQAGEKTASDAATAKTTADAAQKEADFQSRAATAKSQASSNIGSYFSNQGLDPSKYASEIANSVNTASNNVTDLNPNPQGSYAPTMASDLVNQLTAGQQTKNLAGYNAAFSPTYSQTALPSSLLNPAVTSAVDAQFNPLGDQLNNAQKRGTLNATGYDAALKALGTARTGANATVSKLGTGVLDADRQALDSYIGTGRTAAGSAPLNFNFSNDPYITGAADMSARDVANFGGDVQNAVGATKFSDITQLLNAGGSVQGANDPTATNPVGAVGPNGQPIAGVGGAGLAGGDLSPSYLAAQAIAQQKRGLGAQGAF